MFKPLFRVRHAIDNLVILESAGIIALRAISFCEEARYDFVMVMSVSK